ncbi:unnamed protein product [Sphagnum jensenii]|uniref:CHAT domain-containing protein n=1 Tax=Sphagnum jensenii TaxID=128206 RepID=A0ABP0ZXZ4_9BRYO
MSDSDVRTLKQQCKEFVTNKYKSVVWKVQMHYFDYSKTKECLRWAREGNKLYKERYSDKLDYISKYNEAFLLFTSGAFERAKEVCEGIISELDSEPLKGKAMDDHPAAQYCDPQYEFDIHSMLGRCYEQMAVQSGRGKTTDEWIQLANREQEKCESLLGESELQGEISHALKCRADALEDAANNKGNGINVKSCYHGSRWEEGYEQYFATSWGESAWVQFAALEFLQEIHTDFRTKYRQSYESGLPDESHFSTAESCAMKLLEPNFYSPGSHSHSQTGTFVDLVRLYHEKDRQIMFSKQSSNAVNVNVTDFIVQYGKKAIECYRNELIQHAEDDDYWISVQYMYKDVYYMLQFHYFALWIASHRCTLDSTCDIPFPHRFQQLWNQSLMREGASSESSVSQEFWKLSLVWAERRLAKTIYFQLDPNMLSTSAMEQLGEFDTNDDAAWNTLKSSRAACGLETFVLEYSVSEGNDLQFIYVMTKEDKVYTHILNYRGFESTLRKMLVWLGKMFSQHADEGTTEAKRKVLNGCLEWIYEMLISPVADLLNDMEEEDKLIIVAPEILSNVPFAALRKPNSPEGEGYLIQSHTICVTPSLRMLERCKQRLKELDQDGLLDTKPGTIVAVGDPACKARLEASGEEVDFIEEVFGEEYVKKLVGSEATPSEVLKWAKYPSEDRVKQVVMHIAAHGIGQDDRLEVKKGAIVLAWPASSCQQNYGTAGQGAMLRAQDDENFDYDNAHDETELGDLSFSMVDGNEEAQISSHGEVGGVGAGIVAPLSKHPDLLKSEDISGCGFQWKAHMVVLSACDTAIGQITSEGVLNLPRALMIAGVPCVVVSQWQVGDSSTCDLMKGFYRELRSGKDVCSSLRAAMLKRMKKRAKIPEWAPFFVCGWPRVCLPTELQAGTSSCEGHDGGTSSDTKAEQRFKDVKVKPLDLVSYINRFPKLAGDELDERSHINRFLELVGGKPHEFSDINHLLEKLDDLLDSLYWHENLEYALWGEG